MPKKTAKAKAAKKTSAKKTTKVTKKRSVTSKVVVDNQSTIATPQLAENLTPSYSSPINAPKLNSKFLTLALIVVAVGLLTYKIGPWLVPAMVGGTPITRWEVLTRLEKNYGKQAIDDMINEKTLAVAIKKQGVKVDEAKINSEIGKLEERYKDLGGLDVALSESGLTRKDLAEQIRTQLSVEEILKDKITPTDEEIKSAFDENSKTVYKDKKFDDVKAEIEADLKQSKLRDAFLSWFGEVKKDIQVKNFTTVVTPTPVDTSASAAPSTSTAPQDK